MPTIVRKGYSSPLVNDKDLANHMAQQLVEVDLVSPESMITEFRPVTGSEDAHMLVHGLDGVKVGFLAVGTAPPAMVEKAKKEGKALKFIGSLQIITRFKKMFGEFKLLVGINFNHRPGSRVGGEKP